MNQLPRTIYTNCTIITCDPSHPRAHAIIVKGDRIVAIGDAETVAGVAGTGTRRVDLDGACVIPGFDDCHMHILSLGLSLQQLDIRPDKAPSITDIQRLIGRAESSSKDEDWILGRGYNQNLLAERRHPNRHDLDAVSGNHSVVLWHTSGHVLTANSRALNLAGITSDTSPPPGGEIDRNDSGEPTGVLKERAMDLMRRALPPPSPDQAHDAILAASSALAREGITSASDAATGQHAGITAEVEAYVAALETGNLKTRMVLMPMAQDVVTAAGAPDAMPPNNLSAGAHPTWLRIGAMKIFADGALTTRTAAMRKPYEGSDEDGILTWEPSELVRIVREAHQLGWPVATHAIGDRAVEVVLDAYESTQAHSEDRMRIEHCTICDSGLVARMKAMNVIPVLQPEDIAVLGDAYPASLGEVRAANNSPVSWFREAGLHIAFSSDRPVTPGNPLAGIRAAVERTTASGVVLGPGHHIDAEMALTYYTGGSAYATRTEVDKGRLSPGFLADFAVVDRDITAIPAHEITEANILMTVVGGTAVYET